MSEISINNLLQERGISFEEANSAAKIIQVKKYKIFTRL